MMVASCKYVSAGKHLHLRRYRQLATAVSTTVGASAMAALMGRKGGREESHVRAEPDFPAETGRRQMSQKLLADDVTSVA
jgi:hypothetical protein